MYQMRPAVPADYDFLYSLHRVAIRPSVAATWGWDEAWQANYFAQRFDVSHKQIIVVQAQDVGVVSVEQREDELYLGLIELLPEYQGQGIGTAVIQQIIQQAQQQNLPLTLHVLHTNNAAKRLYERLGFVVTAVTEHKYKMTHTHRYETKPV